QQSGALGGYRWGLEVKRQVQAWEAAQHLESEESARS
ncbi:MAG TPA: 6-O-methylguanine DNA methyltransferase, partial [Halomonas sp.]|nr:6-O-methylguanine DNA methyltransferase [Halomonas sp.]